MGSSHLDPWEKDPFFRAAEEVQQSADRRDPLGPLLFALVLHALVHTDQRLLSILVIWMMVTIIGDANEQWGEGEEWMLFSPPPILGDRTLGIVKLLEARFYPDAGLLCSLAVKSASPCCGTNESSPRLREPSIRAPFARTCNGRRKAVVGLRTGQPMLQ
ncbi:hypothetical protein Tco_0606391 [Tanacetum coccineum]